MLYNIMPENLYPQLPTAPSMSQESFNIEMVRKYYQDIANLKEKYTEKKRKYKNAYNRLLHASTGASSVALASGVSTIGMSVTVVGLPISASLAIVSTVFRIKNKDKRSIEGLNYEGIEFPVSQKHYNKVEK